MPKRIKIQENKGTPSSKKEGTFKPDSTRIEHTPSLFRRNVISKIPLSVQIKK